MAVAVPEVSALEEVGEGVDEGVREQQLLLHPRRTSQTSLSGLADGRAQGSLRLEMMELVMLSSLMMLLEYTMNTSTRRLVTSKL